MDVAVVGLGAMGSSVLYQCARSGLRTVGFDLAAPPHTLGSSHGDTRITRLGVGEGSDYVPFVKASHRIWRRLEDETGETLLTQVGTLVIAGSGGRNSHHGKEDFVGRTRRAAAEHGIAHEILSAEEIARRFPYLVGLQGDEIAYYEPEGGFVRPEACIRVQLAAAGRLGAQLRTDSKVLGLSCSQGGPVTVETASGPVVADKVVVCAGAWTSELLGDALPDVLSVTRQVLHWFELEDVAAVPEHSPVLIWMHGAGDSDYFYAFPPQPGEGSMKFATEQYLEETSPAAVRRDVLPEESAHMFDCHIRGRVAGISPRPSRQAACMYTSTPDRGFILDSLPSAPEIFVVSACSGHGFKHSGGIGEAVAAHLRGEGDGHQLSPFSLSRFRQPPADPVPRT